MSALARFSELQGIVDERLPGFGLACRGHEIDIVAVALERFDALALALRRDRPPGRRQVGLLAQGEEAVARSLQCRLEAIGPVGCAAEA